MIPQHHTNRSQTVSTLKSVAELCKLSVTTVGATTLTSGPFVKNPAVRTPLSQTLEPGPQTAVAALSLGPSLTTPAVQNLTSSALESTSQKSVVDSQTVEGCHDSQQKGLRTWNMNSQSWSHGSRTCRRMPKEVFGTKLPFQQLPKLSHRIMALNQLGLGELRQRLISHGEEAPRSWSKAQALLRLTEIEGLSSLKMVKEKSPLHQLETNLNKAAREKSDLVQLVTELGINLTGNETCQILLLKGLDKAAQITPGHQQDPTGIWKLLPKDLHGGVLGGTGLLQVGDANSIRGQLMSTSSAPGPVVEPTRSQGCQHDASQQEEATQGERPHIKDL